MSNRAVTIDLGNATALPGLVDAHTHLLSGFRPSVGDDQQRSLVRMVVCALENLQRDLVSGVTTLRCMGDPSFLDVDMKAVLKDAVRLGPELVVSTRGLQASGGTIKSLSVITLDHSQSLLDTVKENLGRGADIVKMFATGSVSSPHPTVPLFRVDEIRAAVEEAHGRGKSVAAHAYGSEAIRACLDAGVDAIEHGGLIGDDEIAIMRDKGTWLVVSINVYRHLAAEGDIPQGLFLDIERTLQNALRRGVRYAIGTDGMHGSLCEDIIQICEWGVATQEALTAVTSDAARICGIANRLGTIEPGKIANIIAVEDDPFSDVRKLRKTIFVMREGTIIRSPEVGTDVLNSN